MPKEYTCKLCFTKVELTRLKVCDICDTFQIRDMEIVCFCVAECYGRHMKAHEPIDIV